MHTAMPWRHALRLQRRYASSLAENLQPKLPTLPRLTPASAGLRKITVVSSPQELAAPLARLLQPEEHRDTFGHVVLGFDTESPPNSGISLLQLSSSQSALLVQLRSPQFMAAGVLPEELRHVLWDPAVFKVGQVIHPEARQLWNLYRFAPANESKAMKSTSSVSGPFSSMVDTQHLAGRLNARNRIPDPLSPGSEIDGPVIIGLKALVRLHLGMEMTKSKSIQCSDWGLSTLSAQQVEYAALDAWASRAVFVRMSEKLASLNDLDLQKGYVAAIRSLAIGADKIGLEKLAKFVTSLKQKTGQETVAVLNLIGSNQNLRPLLGWQEHQMPITWSVESVATKSRPVFQATVVLALKSGPKTYRSSPCSSKQVCVLCCLLSAVCCMLSPDLPVCPAVCCTYNRLLDIT
jgi:hypothetical protein